MKSKGGGIVALALLLGGCAGQRAQSSQGGSAEQGALDAEAEASASSEPLRAGQTSAEVSEAVVGAVQGWLDEREGEPDPPSLLECLLERAVFRSFAAMLLVTGLEEELAEEPHTVLVPHDRAFQLLSLERRLELFEFGDVELMEDVLRRHVVRGFYSSEDMAKAGELSTLGGTRIQIEAIGGIPVLEGAQVLGSRRTEGGVMHEIDRVLLPE